MSLLPPCRTVLRLHIKRANFVAAIWKHATQAMIDPPRISTMGWNENGSIEWIKAAFPRDIEEMLLDDEFDEHDYEFGGEGDSDDE